MAANVPANAPKGGALVSHDYGEYAGQGFDNVTSDDNSIPFLAILQSNSPQLTDDKFEAANLKAGMLFNTVSEEAVAGKEGCLFLPAVTQHVVVRWKPRDAGGGVVAVLQLDDAEYLEAKAKSEKFGKYKASNGDEFVETFYVYGVICDSDGNPETPAVVAFTSTKIKVYKKWMSKVNMFAHKKFGIPVKPPLFAHLIRITSFKDSNPSGEFFNFVLQPAKGDVASSLLSPKDDAFQAAAALRDAVGEGLAKADYKSQDKAGDQAAGDASGDKAPF